MVLKLQDPDNEPMDIKSARAVFERQEGLLKFIDNVEVVQGGDRLTAGRFLVNIADDTQAVYRAQAIDDVNLWMGGGAARAGPRPRERRPRPAPPGGQEARPVVPARSHAAGSHRRDPTRS